MVFIYVFNFIRAISDGISGRSCRGGGVGVLLRVSCFFLKVVGGMDVLVGDRRTVFGEKAEDIWKRG